MQRLSALYNLREMWCSWGIHLSWGSMFPQNSTMCPWFKYSSLKSVETQTKEHRARNQLLSGYWLRVTSTTTDRMASLCLVLHQKALHPASVLR